MSLRRVFLLASLVVALAALFGGCVAGVRHLGQVPLKDGTIREYIQVGTEGQDGPVMVIVEGYSYDPATNESRQTNSYHAAGPSLTSDILKGASAAAMIAGGEVGKGALTRPARTNVTQGSPSATTGAVTASPSATTGAVTASPSATTGAVTASPTQAQTASPSATGGAGGAGGQGGTGGTSTSNSKSCASGDGNIAGCNN